MRQNQDMVYKSDIFINMKELIRHILREEIKDCRSGIVDIIKYFHYYL